MKIYRKTQTANPGFTIVEVLIALAASLLLMLGLTRAYKLIGDRITESQSSLELSSTLRDLTFRLRDELRRRTSEMVPPGKTSNGDGYLVYYEGPFSDTTTIMGDAPPSPPAVPEPIPDYYPSSRFGDIDDYLAFTARAEEGSPFVGFIPRGILEANRYARIALDPNLTDPEKASQIALLYGSYTNADAVTPAPFYANYAEIAYWLSPRWSRLPNGDIDYDPGSGHPLYPDVNGDQLPDRLDLHRRVLLIRPDLNMEPARMLASYSGSTPGTLPVDWHTPQLPFLIKSGASLQVVPLTKLSGNEPFFDASTTLQAPGNWFGGVNSVAPNWLCGLARMQQVIDLSVSRVNNTWSTPRDPTVAATTTSTYGMPSPIVQANSLAQLARPENRFAHVRIPESLVSGSATASTMPQIVLSPPHPYLTLRQVHRNATADDVIFPHQADHNVGASGPGTLPQFAAYGRFTLVGFLRPEFNLSDTVSDVAAGGSGVVGVNRSGADVVASDLLGFNLQIYDPAAPKYIWVGPDGASGTSPPPAGAGNDDGDSDTLFDFDELGWPDSDDELVTLDELRSLEVLLDDDGLGTTPQVATYSGPGPYPNRFHLADRGSFVDLNYTRQPGGSMRGIVHHDIVAGVLPPLSDPSMSPVRLRELASPISGMEIFPPPPGAPTFISFPNSWERSGRFVISQPSGVNTLSSFYQPVIDTWTDNYGRDEFDQEGLSTAPGGFAFGAFTTIYDERYGTQPPESLPSIARSVQYRQWSNRAGVNTDSGFAGQDAGNGVGALTGSSTPIPSTPPVEDKVHALKITIRVFDQSAGQIRQQTVIESFQ